MLLKLNDEDMKKLGMKLGQRKRITKYINHFTKKIDKDIYSGISKDSSKSEVEKFLKEKLNISDKTIEYLELDGETLFLVEPDDIEGCDIPNSEKESLCKFIEEMNKTRNETGSVNDRTKFNIFIVFGFEEKYYENINISFYGKKIKEKGNIYFHHRYCWINNQF